MKVSGWIEKPDDWDTVREVLEGEPFVVSVGDVGSGLLVELKDNKTVHTWGITVRERGWVVTGMFRSEGGTPFLHFAPLHEVLR